MSLSIREIDLTHKKDLNAFINLPWSIYKDDPHWVPPLKMAVNDLLNVKKHPFYQTAKVAAWIAYKGERPVGRIMAINNFTYIKFTNSNVGHFGFYEAIHDDKVSELLLKTAEQWLKKEGLTSVQGPMNPGTNYECGLLVEGFQDPPQIMMTYNPPYYIEQLEKHGYTKTMDLLAYRFKRPFELPKVILDIAERTEKKEHITFRDVNMKKWEQELDLMFEIYNSAWEANWGFVPMMKEEFYHTAKDLKSIVDPTLIQFVEVNGVAAGFIITLPDLHQIFKQNPKGTLNVPFIYKLLTAKKRITRARTITMGIKKEFRKMGIETLLYKYNQKSLLKNPLLKEVEMSWILETNIEMNKPLIRMSGPAYKRYRIYERSL